MINGILLQITQTAGDSLGKGTAFGIGVASNPTAINMESEVRRWGFKVESGAHYAVTQPIFDPEAFLKWKDLIGKNYLPQIVGIWPLVSLRNAEFMANEIPGVHMPSWVLEEMAKSRSRGFNRISQSTSSSRITVEIIVYDSRKCVDVPPPTSN